MDLRGFKVFEAEEALPAEGRDSRWGMGAEPDDDWLMVIEGGALRRALPPGSGRLLFVK